MTYNTKNMNAIDAKRLVALAKKSVGLKYPIDNDVLKSLCNNVYDYMSKNALTQTAFFEELGKRMDNLKFPVTGHKIHKDIFYHMQSELQLHGILIGKKFRIATAKDFI